MNVEEGRAKEAGFRKPVLQPLTFDILPRAASEGGPYERKRV